MQSLRARTTHPISRHLKPNGIATGLFPPWCRLFPLATPPGCRLPGLLRRLPSAGQTPGEGWRPHGGRCGRSGLSFLVVVVLVAVAVVQRKERLAGGHRRYGLRWQACGSGGGRRGDPAGRGRRDAEGRGRQGGKAGGRGGDSVAEDAKVWSSLARFLQALSV